jgi:hypothetical protein
MNFTLRNRNKFNFARDFFIVDSYDQQAQGSIIFEIEFLRGFIEEVLSFSKFNAVL